MFKKLKAGIALLIVGSMLFSSSCMINFSYFYDHDQKLANNLVDALKQKDKNSVRKLFSQNAISDAKDFEGQLDDLFEYVSGEINSVTEPHSSESASAHYGHVVRKLYGTFRISTNNTTYTVDYCKCIKDTDDRKNVGLVSLRVYTSKDADFYDPENDSEYKPHGFPIVHPDTILDVPGIFTPQAPEVILENEEDSLVKRVIDALGIWNKCGIRNAFAYSVMKSDGYEEQLSSLFDYFEGTYQSLVRREYSEEETILHGNVVILETRAVYEVKTDKEDYLFILYSTPKYNADPKMRGIQSLRVIRAADEALYFPDWSVVEENPGIFVPQE